MELGTKLISKLSQLYSDNRHQELLALCRKTFLRSLTPYHTYCYALEICKKVANKENIKNPLSSSSKISVITVNYNNCEGLIKTVESVQNQLSRDLIQFIIIDGNSTDESLSYLKSLEGTVEVMVFGSDKGVYDAMNRGIILSDSEYSIFMNSGDCFDSNDIISEVNDFSNKKNFPEVIYGSARLSTGVVWSPLSPSNLWKGMICSHQSIFFNTTLLKKYNYNLNNTIVSDYELITTLYTLNHSFKKIDRIIADIEPVGISADFTSRTIERWNVTRKLNHANISKESIDNFYRTLLSTRGEWVAPHSHEIDNGHASVISGVQKRLIFLISMPRSGSTLLQKVLDSSDQIETAGEPWLMLPLLSMYDKELIDAKYGQEFNIGAKNALVEEMGVSDIVETAQRLYADSVYSTLLSKTDKKFFLDKTPRYIYVVDKLSKLYPQAKFIVLLRNPAAIISSYATTWRGGDYTTAISDEHYSYDFSVGFEKLAVFKNSDFKNKIVVKYEDIVEKPIESARKIFNYLGVKFNENYINYGSSGSPKKYAYGDPKSVYSNSRPDSSHAYKWLESIKTIKNREALLNTIESIGGPLIDELGYSSVEIVNSINSHVCKGVKEPRLIADLGDNDLAIKNLRSTGILDHSKNCSLGVLITSYNNASTISYSIDSVSNQSKKPDLIVIADDNSSDKTIQIVKEKIKNYPKLKFKLIERVNNVGVSKNRDSAIREMDVDFITTLDGDDEFYPGKLEAEFLLLAGRKDIVVFSDTVILEKDKFFRLDSSAYNKKDKQSVVNMLLSRSTPVPRDMMFSKQLYLKADGFDLDINLYEDWALKMRLAYHTAEAGWLYTGAIGTVYDRRSPGLSSKDSVVLAYGQLLAIARNSIILGKIPGAIKSGLLTVASCLKEDNGSRLRQYANKLNSKANIDVAILKLQSLWNNRAEKFSNQELYKKIWQFSASQSAQEYQINKIEKPSVETSSDTHVYICTPVFNGAETIGRTIESVVTQKADVVLHYHVQDGGSQDETLNILENWNEKIQAGEAKIGVNKIYFTYSSEKDNGMYDAIQKSFDSFSLTKGAWMTWINSDDYLASSAFDVIKKIDTENPEVKWVTGKTTVIHTDGRVQDYFQPINSEVIKNGLCDGTHWGFVQQEGTFWTVDLWNQLDKKILTNYKYAGDWYLWYELSFISELYVVSSALGNFCKREGQISEAHIDDYYQEIDSVISKDDRRHNLVNFPIHLYESNVIDVNDKVISIRKLSIEKYLNFRINRLLEIEAV